MKLFILGFLVLIILSCVSSEYKTFEEMEKEIKFLEKKLQIAHRIKPKNHAIAQKQKAVNQNNLRALNQIDSTATNKKKPNGKKRARLFARREKLLQRLKNNDFKHSKEKIFAERELKVIKMKLKKISLKNFLRKSLKNTELGKHSKIYFGDENVKMQKSLNDSGKLILGDLVMFVPSIQSDAGIHSIEINVGADSNKSKNKRRRLKSGGHHNDSNNEQSTTIENTINETAETTTEKKESFYSNESINKKNDKGDISVESSNGRKKIKRKNNSKESTNIDKTSSEEKTTTKKINDNSDESWFGWKTHTETNKNSDESSFDGFKTTERNDNSLETTISKSSNEHNNNFDETSVGSTTTTERNSNEITSTEKNAISEETKTTISDNTNNISNESSIWKAEREKEDENQSKGRRRNKIFNNDKWTTNRRKFWEKEVDKCGGKCEQLCVDGVCDCRRGYLLMNDNITCLDVNECSFSNGKCQHECTNLMGSYECSCYPGYQLDTKYRQTCHDINECHFNNDHGDCQDKCHNTIGSYYCTCENLNGTRLSRDRKTCVDIDECNEGISGCSDKCINTYNGFRCGCPQGFKLGKDDKTCEDIDECQEEDIKQKCVICKNIPGSYICPLKTDELPKDQPNIVCPKLLSPDIGYYECNRTNSVKFEEYSRDLLLNSIGALCDLICPNGDMKTVYCGNDGKWKPLEDEEIVCSK